jgi:hypothetical protein
MGGAYDCDVVWLHGRQKDRAGKLVHDDRNRGVEGWPVIDWVEATPHRDEPTLVGDAYYGHPPCCTTVGYARRVLRGDAPGAGKEPGYFRTKSAEIGCKVGWLQTPVFYHIGETGYKKLGGKR